MQKFAQNSPVFMNEYQRKKNLNKARKMAVNGRSERLSIAMKGKTTKNPTQSKSLMKIENQSGFDSTRNLDDKRDSVISTRRDSINATLYSLQQESLTTIKDMGAFNKKSKMRLEELVNPTGDATGVFDTGKFINISNSF